MRGGPYISAIGLNGVDGGTDDGMVERLEFCLLMKDDIGGEFHLHETPVVTGVEALMYWAELLGPPIESLVELFGIQPVGKRLGPLRIGNKEKGIVCVFWPIVNTHSGST